MRVAVVGSLNIDYFTQVDSFPRPGETVIGRDLTIRFGGKGANQAVAAARLGADVRMIGCVGDDETGCRYRERMESEGIDCSGLTVADGVATGSAFITLDPAGENTIVVAPGANAHVTAGHIRVHSENIAHADCLLLQNEIPADANRAAMDIARASGTRIICNPAPWDESRRSDLALADLLIVNEHEARIIGGFKGDVITTRGAAPTIAFVGGRTIEYPTVRVIPVDTVGAGDTFVGAIAALDGDILLANRAAALATLKKGAQEAMPTLQAVAGFRPE